MEAIGFMELLVLSRLTPPQSGPRSGNTSCHSVEDAAVTRQLQLAAVQGYCEAVGSVSDPCAAAISMLSG